MSLANDIRRAKAGEEDAQLYLIGKFMPLIKKYSYKLNYKDYEDAKSELTLKLLELISTFPLDRMQSQTDGALVNYISSSIYHAYLSLQRVQFAQTSGLLSLDQMTEEQLHHRKDLRTEPPPDPDWQISEGLTGREAHVLTMVYSYGYTSAEIATRMGTSKQNINQIKLRALRKLKAKLQQEESI